MEVQVTHILEPGEVQNGRLDPTPTMLPKRTRLESGKLSPKMEIDHLRRIKLHYVPLSKKHDCYICSASPNIHQYLAPHFTYTKVPPDWEVRVANGATEPNRSWDDLVLADVTRVFDLLIDKLEKKEIEDAKREEKEKRLQRRRKKQDSNRKKTLQDNNRRKKRKLEDGSGEKVLDPFANLKSNPPSAKELYVKATIEQALANNNTKMTYFALLKTLRTAFDNLSEEERQPWLNAEKAQMKKWGNLYLLFLSRGGFLKCVGFDPCPKGMKPKRGTHAFGGFDYFFAEQRATMAIGGFELKKHEAKIIWNSSLDDKAKSNYKKMAESRKRRLRNAWKSWELKMEHENNFMPVVERVLNDVIKRIVGKETRGKQPSSSKKRTFALTRTKKNATKKKAIKPKATEKTTKSQASKKRLASFVDGGFKCKRKICPNCSKSYQAAYLKRHLRDCLPVNRATDDKELNGGSWKKAKS